MNSTPPGPQTVPERTNPVRHCDPLAVAIANASLFSAGYLMLGRKLPALATGLTTVTLVIVLATTERTVWFEVVVLGWWLAVVVHGWSLARQQRHRAWRQRLGALGLTLPVLLVIALLRWDAARIAQDVADAPADRERRCHGSGVPAGTTGGGRTHRRAVR